MIFAALNNPDILVAENRHQPYWRDQQEFHWMLRSGKWYKERDIEMEDERNETPEAPTERPLECLMSCAYWWRIGGWGREQMEWLRTLVEAGRRNTHREWWDKLKWGQSEADEADGEWRYQGVPDDVREDDGRIRVIGESLAEVGADADGEGPTSIRRDGASESLRLRGGENRNFVSARRHIVNVSGWRQRRKEKRTRGLNGEMAEIMLDYEGSKSKVGNWTKFDFFFRGDSDLGAREGSEDVCWGKRGSTHVIAGQEASGRRGGLSRRRGQVTPRPRRRGGAISVESLDISP